MECLTAVTTEERQNDMKLRVLLIKVGKVMADRKANEELKRSDER